MTLWNDAGSVTTRAAAFYREHGPEAGILAGEYANALLSIGDTRQAALWKRIAALLGGHASASKQSKIFTGPGTNLQDGGSLAGPASPYSPAGPDDDTATPRPAQSWPGIFWGRSIAESPANDALGQVEALERPDAPAE